MDNMMLTNKKDIYAIIDVGSNTIRLSIYTFENNAAKLLLNKKTMAGLVSYIENGAMSPKGIQKACKVLNSYKNICENFTINHIAVFATASLRNITNTDEAVREITKATGLAIDVVSGKEEATLDFIGATHDLDTSHDGLLVDIGGGSTELVSFEKGQILQAVSLPIGSLSLYNKYVEKLLPKAKERRAIRQAVILELAKIADLIPQKYALLCGVGGTLRAAAKLNNDLYEIYPPSKKLPADHIKTLLDLLDGRDAATLQRILKVTPDRIHTIIPGLIILNAIIDYFGSETIFATNCGIREGYLYHKVLQK